MAGYREDPALRFLMSSGYIYEQQLANMIVMDSDTKVSYVTNDCPFDQNTLRAWIDLINGIYVVGTDHIFLRQQLVRHDEATYNANSAEL
jgi:hypothetical protein